MGLYGDLPVYPASISKEYLVFEEKYNWSNKNRGNRHLHCFGTFRDLIIMTLFHVHVFTRPIKSQLCSVMSEYSFLFVKNFV